MSPRTANYIEALIRGGDSFDYIQWLKSVRAEEAQARKAEATGARGELAAALRDNSISMPDDQHARPNPALRLMAETIRVPRVLRSPYRRAKNHTPKTRLRRWLEEVRDAWERFQSSRARDAVYDYLAAVFGIVMHYKERRRTNRLLRRLFKFADLPFDKHAEPFAAVIRCTCTDCIDNRMISKWARALRYVAHCEVAPTKLRMFMKRAGGINACADRYAEYFGRGT
jgi:hypothetical protein